MINLIDGDQCAHFGFFRRLVIQREVYAGEECVTARVEFSDGALGQPWVIQCPESIEFKSTEPLFKADT